MRERREERRFIERKGAPLGKNGSLTFSEETRLELEEGGENSLLAR